MKANSRIKRTLRSQRGVAMATVIFVAAGLTVIGSTTAFVAIEEFKANRDDRRAAEAVSFSESGIDRFLYQLRLGTYTWNELNEAGCQYPPITIPKGWLGPGQTYTAQLTVYDPDEPVASRLPTEPWSSSNDTAAPCTTRLATPHPTPDDGTDNLFAITSTGNHPAARRMIRQVVEIEALGLPIGIFAESTDGNGSVSMHTLSFLSSGDIKGREKMGFVGLDPYYSMYDFYAGTYSATEPVPTAAHALGSIYCVSVCSTGTDKKREHPPSPNCQANPAGDTGQSLWDGSGDGVDFSSDSCTTAATSTHPNTSRFDGDAMARVAPRPVLSEQDYQILKEAAKLGGLYCTPTECTRAGSQPATFATPETFFETDLVGLPNSFITFFDYPTTTGSLPDIEWKAEWKTCTDDPATSKSVVMIARNSNLKLNQSSQDNEIVGAFLVPDGRLEATGFTVHGTVIAKEFWLRGNATFKNSACWVKNMPGAFLQHKAVRWNEIDR